MYEEDTIAAVATPPGEGGIAIVRLSGPEAEHIAETLFHSSNGTHRGFESHRLHHGLIRHPASGEPIDEVLTTLMRRPRSYTGEDVVEVHCHGGPFIARRILELALACGARHAEAGEFTKRAFLNGRLDLTQAEAVSDLIRARTDKAARLASGQAQGEISKWVGSLRADLLDILVQVEAAIDFPEEEIDLLARRELTVKAEALMDKISVIINTYEWGRLFREGAKVCIAGRPNVGKSSLLNTLLGEERVIVTPTPGTTRDFIEESLNLGGLPLALWDTAGIHSSENDAERKGIQFSLERMKKADAIIFVLDGSEPLAPEDRFILNQSVNAKCLIILNKCDLPQLLDLTQVGSVAPGKEVISISAKEGTGIDELKLKLRSLLVLDGQEPEVIVTNLRHKTALEKGRDSLACAIEGLRLNVSPEMVAVDLQEARHHLEEVVGIVTNDHILGQIFSQFCIGK